MYYQYLAMHLEFCYLCIIVIHWFVTFSEDWFSWTQFENTEYQALLLSIQMFYLFATNTTTWNILLWKNLY